MVATSKRQLFHLKQVFSSNPRIASCAALQATMKEGARLYFDIMLTYGMKVSKLKTINNSNNCKVIFILGKTVFENVVLELLQYFVKLIKCLGRHSRSMCVKPWSDAIPNMLIRCIIGIIGSHGTGAENSIFTFFKEEVPFSFNIL